MKNIVTCIAVYFCIVNSALAGAGWTNYINQEVGASLYYLHESVLYLFPSQCPNCRAFSFGSGPGNEEIDLIKKGWVVTSNDINPLSGEIITERAKIFHGRFAFQNVDFSGVKLIGQYDYFFSFFALPFGDKNEMQKLVRHMSLYSKKDTLVALNFFGPEHDYVKQGIAFSMEKEEVAKLLESNRFRVLYILRRIYDKVDVDGIKTHRDVIDVMARKK